jgi:DNA-binding transcriptional MerR regulator
LSRYFQVQEFAELAGVTVKALHHYDRLGLLKPRRTEAGYRMYTQTDLERLEQVVALRFIGFPLKQIKLLLDGEALELGDALRMQRKAIEEKQWLLARAVRAIRAAEEALLPGKPADPAILKRIIEVIDMQEDIATMKRYYRTEAAWEMRRRYYEEGPDEEWKALYRDIKAALHDDDAGERAQALAERWLNLSVRAYGGDPNVQTDSMTAWLDREHWPPAMKQRLAEYNMEEVVAFVKRVAMAARKKYFSDPAWARLPEITKRNAQDFSRTWQTRLDLFCETEAALGEDPAGAKARALAARWMEQREADSGGDPEVKEGAMRAWADRHNWPAIMRWQTEALYRTTFDRFERVADFIDEALAVSTNPASA